MKRSKQTKNNSKDKHTSEKELPKTYIPTEESTNHDLFIDLLSYGRSSFTSHNDLWSFEYV